MKKVNLYNLYKVTSTAEEPLLMPSDNLDLFPFMLYYKDNYQDFDNLIAKKYSDFYPVWNLDKVLNVEAVLKNFQMDVKSELRMKYDNYNRLYEAMGLEYSPLENYDRTETETTTHSGTDTLTDSIGKVSTSTKYGENVQSNQYGSQSNSTKSAVYGFNSSTGSPDGEETESIGSKSDTLTTAAKTDENTTEARTDTHETVKNLTDIRENKTHGNIGVTTSQQMLQSEIDLRKAYCFYEDLIFDLVKSLCCYYSRGCDAFGLSDDDDIEMSENTSEQ